MTTITSTTKATHIESLMSEEEQARFYEVLASTVTLAFGVENASTTWRAFLVSLVIEHGTREAACRLGTAIAKAKTLVIRTTEGGDKAIDAAMAATDLATNWARKVLRQEYRYALKLSKPKRNKVLAGGDEYRLLEVEELAKPRTHVVTPSAPVEVSEPESTESESEGMAKVDPTDLDALLNLAISVHGLESLTRAILRRNGATPEIADRMTKTLPDTIRKVISKRAPGRTGTDG